MRKPGGLQRRTLTLLVALPLVALSLVAAAELVPDRWIIGELERGYTEGSLTPTLVNGQRNGGLTDHYGECVLLSIGVGALDDASLLELAALSPNLHQCVSLQGRLDTHAQGEPLEGIPKVRYWNGTSVITRPLLPVVGVTGLRSFAALSLATAVVALAVHVKRWAGPTAMVGLIVGLWTADLVGLVEVFHHPLMLAVGLAGATWVGRVAERGATGWPLVETAWVAGSIYSFIDLMNFVTGVVALVSVAASVATPHATQRTRVAVTATVGWVGGYGTMWAAKWVFAAVASSPAAVLDDVRSQFAFRLDGEHQGISGRFGAGLQQNVEAWFGQRMSVALIVALTIMGVVLVVRHHSRASTLFGVVAVATVPIVVFMLAANNHNEIHWWFEYRSLGMWAAAVFIAVAAKPASRSA